MAAPHAAVATSCDPPSFAIFAFFAAKKSTEGGFLGLEEFAGEGDAFNGL